jgi:hypothetical protein
MGSCRPLVLGVLSACLACAQQFNVYFGNLHSHTAYSDGSGTPQQAYDHARTQARLDFLLISEHNHAAAEGTGTDPKRLHIALDNDLYSGSQAASLISTANKINSAFPNQFVALYGQEFSTNSGGNHINVFDVSRVIDEQLVPNKDFKKLYDSWLVANLDSMGRPAIVQFNHPKSFNQDYGVLNYGNTEALLAASAPYARTIQIINGPHSATDGGHRVDNIKSGAYLRYLNAGFRLAPTADQDNHFINHGSSTDHRTAVLATTLTKASILDGIRRNRVYATQDKNLKVWFTINDELMGSTLALAPGTPLSIKVRIEDADEPTATYRVSLRRDIVGEEVDATDELDHQDVTGNTTATFNDFQYRGGREYFLVHIVQQGDDDPDQVWTAPIWLMTPSAPVDEHEEDHDDEDHPAVTPVAAVPKPRAAGRYVWTRRSDSEVYHLTGCRNAEDIHPNNRVTGRRPPAGRRLHNGCPR